MNQKNILSEQLFFIIDSQLNADYVTRIIKDLGIDNPRVIDTLNDESIQKYMQVYPVTDYIYQSILKLREQTDALYEMLMEKKRISEIKNREVYEKINALENHINNLKDSLNSFLTKDNMEIPWEWTHEKNTFLGCIKNWRLRKTKMVGEDEIWKMANELYSSTTIWYEDFLSAFKGWVQSTTLENINKYRSWYEKGNYDTSFIPSNIRKTDIPDLQLPNFVSELIKIKKEEKFDNSNSFFGKLFGAPAPTDDEPEIQTVAYYQEWRDYVVNQLSPILDKYVQDYFDALVEFLEKESTEYEKHISDLLDQLTNQKDEVSSKLSGEEKLLQDDIDWCMEFIDQVKEIERG